MEHLFQQIFAVVSCNDPNNSSQSIYSQDSNIRRMAAVGVRNRKHRIQNGGRANRYPIALTLTLTSNYPKRNTHFNLPRQRRSAAAVGTTITLALTNVGYYVRSSFNWITFVNGVIPKSIITAISTFHTFSLSCLSPLARLITINLVP